MRSSPAGRAPAPRPRPSATIAAPSPPAHRATAARGPRPATSRPPPSPCGPPAAPGAVRADACPCRRAGAAGELEPPGGSGAASGASATSSTLSRWSSSVVQAPGSGVTPRKRSRTASAGAAQSRRASSMPSFGANVGSPSCVVAVAVPAAIRRPLRPAGRRRRRRARRAAYRPWRPARSGCERMRVHVARVELGHEPEHGCPGRASPAISACCTGAAPRHAGSSEKCRLIQPCTGRREQRLPHEPAVRDDHAEVGLERGDPGRRVLAESRRLDDRDADASPPRAPPATASAPACARAGPLAGDDGDDVMRACREPFE